MRKKKQVIRLGKKKVVIDLEKIDLLKEEKCVLCKKRLTIYYIDTHICNECMKTVINKIVRYRFKGYAETWEENFFVLLILWRDGFDTAINWIKDGIIKVKEIMEEKHKEKKKKVEYDEDWEVETTKSIVT